MKKGRVAVRLMMLIFLLFFPLYKLYTMGTEYMTIREGNERRKTEVSKGLRDSFLMRKDDFYQDKNYQRELKKLRRE